MNQEFSLGRLEQFDERSLNFPVMALISTAQATAPRSYTWSCSQYLNQGNIGACVGFSWAHELVARPTVLNASYNSAMQIYKDAQKIDEWAGESYEGTSVLAGAKVMKSLGWLHEYRWAFNVNDLILAVGYKGPAVLGIPWYDGMFSPDNEGIIRPTGPVVGGHAILCNGVSLKKQLFRLHNSWGVFWGHNGDAFISFDNMAKLLSEHGEACIPVKRGTGLA
jgi:hypothetical protein